MFLGILNMEGGSVLKNILGEFNNIGYKVDYKLLNAAEYGIPQIRERVIFIGTRLNVDISFPIRTHSIKGETGYKKALTLWDAIGDLPQHDTEEVNHYDKPPFNDYQKTLRGSCTELTLHTPSKHSNKAFKMMKYIPEGKSVWDVKDIPVDLIPTSGYGNTYARLSSKVPGMTITRNFACISSSRCIHPFLNRGLTAREAARIQSYDDSYIFKGPKTDIHLQIGNSVPPILGNKIANTIKDILDIAII